MRFRDDRRAAALQVGAILLLGFLVIGLALYQSTVVPDQNERVEFDHNQQVQESLQDVRNGILRTAAAERTSPTTVPLGTRYPTRIVAVNPPPSSGRLATDSGGDVTLVNATAINDETADYWNGTNRSYASQRLTYDPDYSVYQNAPRTVYDDTVLYNEFDGGSRAATGQRLLEGNLIYVVALNGSLGRSGTQAVSVSPTPVSASDRTVAVNGSDIDIEVDTDLSEEEWERLLEDQYESNGGRIDGNASGVTVSGGTLTVDLVSNRTYRLRMAKVGVGTGVTDTTERYLTVVDGADSVTTGGTRRIVLEVRDGYNNPVSGVTVDASVDGEGSIPESERETVSDGQGQVVYEYDAPDSIPGGSVTDRLNFTFDTPADRPDFSGEEPESVRINVTVVASGGGGGGGSSGSLVEYVDGSAQVPDNQNKEDVRFILRNTGSRSVNVTDISVDSTTDSKAESVSGSVADPSVFTNRTGEVTTGITVGGSAEPFSTPARLPGGSETEFTIGPFVDDKNKERNMQNDEITITVTFADGTSETISLTP
ncbi:hypothetical protein [Haloplanus salinarum]|uniref:hypothetical protein n=1 Tax=Haloplanus salinarum TaxID=1912324 RepID=UPI00214B1500|nr:hypothetical protein [Haloplanus salinarum]